MSTSVRSKRPRDITLTQVAFPMTEPRSRPTGQQRAVQLARTAAGVVEQVKAVRPSSADDSSAFSIRVTAYDGCLSSPS